MPKRGGEEEGKGGEEQDDSGQGGLLGKAIKHCWSDDFLDVFRAYFRKHGEKFEVSGQASTNRTQGTGIQENSFTGGFLVSTGKDTNTFGCYI